METQGSRDTRQYLPHAIVATAIVTLVPVAIVWALQSTGTIESLPLLVLIGMGISLGLARGGRSWWEQRPHARSMLFGDLMLWGWFGRWRAERRMRQAGSLLGLVGPPVVVEELPSEDRLDALEQLAASLEARDPYTHGHSRRVARYAARIAEEMGLDSEDVEKIRLAAALHDIGKLETPMDILNKPDRLSDDELEVVKRHAKSGARLVSVLGDDELTEMISHHHERLDGGGYPSGLAGPEIPIGARIIAVADTFDAITSTRAYRQSRSHRQAMDVLQAEAGTQLDPNAVAAFNRRYADYQPIAIWGLVTQLVPRGGQALLGGAQSASGSLASVAGGVAAAGVLAGGIAAEMGGGPFGPDGAGAAGAPAAREAAGTPAARAAGASVAPRGPRGGSASGGGSSRAGSKGKPGRDGTSGSKGSGRSGNGPSGGPSPRSPSPSVPASPPTGSAPPANEGGGAPTDPGGGGSGGGGSPTTPGGGGGSPPSGPPSTPKLPTVPQPPELPKIPPELPKIPPELPQIPDLPGGLSG